VAGADHPENDMKLNMKKANHDNNFEKLKHVVVSTLAAAAVIKRKFWLMRKAIKSDKLLLWLIEKQVTEWCKCFICISCSLVFVGIVLYTILYFGT